MTYTNVIRRNMADYLTLANMKLNTYTRARVYETPMTNAPVPFESMAHAISFIQQRNEREPRTDRNGPERDRAHTH